MKLINSLWFHPDESVRLMARGGSVVFTVLVFLCSAFGTIAPLVIVTLIGVIVIGIIGLAMFLVGVFEYFDIEP